MVKHKLRILVDPNLSPSLGEWLESTFRFKVIVLRGEHDPRRTDREIADIANDNRAIILTMDRHFADLSKYPICSLPGVIFLELERRTPNYIKETLTHLYAQGIEANAATLSSPSETRKNQYSLLRTERIRSDIDCQESQILAL